MNGLLGPSNFERRYLCPGSYNMEKQLPPEPMSEEAQRGSKLHVALRYAFNARLKDETIDFSKSGLSDEEKTTLSDTVNLIFQNMEIIPDEDIIEFEREVNLQFLGFDQNRGKIDMTIYNPKRREIFIIDFKFGANPVALPSQNWQLKCYAVGVANEFSDLKYITAAIVQPSSKNPWKENDFYQKDIEQYEDEIVRAIQYCKTDSAPLIPGESQCRYCRANHNCPARQNALTQIPHHITFQDHILSLKPKDLALLWKNAHIGKKLCEDWIATLKDAFIDGKINIAGHKVIEGRGNRAWINPETAAETLKSLFAQKGLSPENIMTKPEVITPAQAEKYLGKSKPVAEKLSGLIVQAAGSPKIIETGEAAND